VKLPDLPLNWQKLLKNTNFREIITDIEVKLPEYEEILPRTENVFQAFKKTRVADVKVIIIGQDPYHSPNTAHGLAFSVQKGCKIPPSLRIIFKELKSDMGIETPVEGSLEHWASQGVLLLNTILTVSKGKPNSHKGIGWENFTQLVINRLSNYHSHLVFILWGKQAIEKREWIAGENHLIIESSHPAAEIYSGGKSGFYGHKPFSKTNLFLLKHNKSVIDW
jgi:uracil-DNA glycosylase